MVAPLVWNLLCKTSTEVERSKMQVLITFSNSVIASSASLIIAPNLLATAADLSEARNCLLTFVFLVLLPLYE